MRDHPAFEAIFTETFVFIEKKRWKDNIKEWMGLEFTKSQRAVENREKWRKLVVKSFCGAPMTPTVQG